MNDINQDLYNLKILVVDDTPANLGILRETLEPQGYKLLYANSGEKALEIAFNNFPDLILLDIMMPGIDGFETCDRLKAEPVTKDIPIIFITAKIETEDIVQGFQQGGVDYILKPFQQEEVSARVRTHLELSQLRKKLDEKVRERTQQLNESRLEVVQRLATAGEFRDNETGMHVIRMSHFSALLGKSYGMDEDECELLSAEIKTTLNLAIEAGGSTLKDFAAVDGALGYFQHRFKVYGHGGAPCPRKNCSGVISRTKQSGRSSFYCETCQR